jgi:hypothetical protein
MPFPLADLHLQLPEAPAPHGIHLDGQHRGVVREMLEHAAMLRQQRVEVRLAVGLVAAPQDVMVRARHDLDGVELHEPEPSDDPRHIERPRRRGGETLRVKPKAARVAVGDFQRLTQCAPQFQL